MKIAIEGCAHGELDKIYECIETLQEKEAIKIDLLICCGDFQSVRNNDDLNTMAVPDKYKNICTFYKYYSGEKRAPVLTLFIGGNHEASNYLQELPYGGWVAPNIYYLGRAGVIKYGNLRIGGLSGIFKGKDYLQGLWESPPYNPNSLRSVYHIRNLDVFRLSQLKEKVHVMLSHDWPRGITNYGDRENLLRKKPFFRDDIESNQLGSMPSEKLLHLLKPDYWFSAHLHCQFAALVEHKDGDVTTETKFLALDKCLPKRRHLQILDLPAEFDGDKALRFDAEWLVILKITNHLLTVRNVDCHMPGPGGDERYVYTPTEEEKEGIEKLMGDMLIKEESFVQTAPVYEPGSPRGVPKQPVQNPQTEHLCETLGIDDPLQVVLARVGGALQKSSIVSLTTEVKVDVVTPKRNALSLPAPIASTPSFTVDSPSFAVDSFDRSDSLCATDKSDASFTSSLATPECETPVSRGKKSFKRRNQALYTPVEEVKTDDTPALDKSPTSSKQAYKPNSMVYLS